MRQNKGLIRSLLVSLMLIAMLSLLVTGCVKQPGEISDGGKQTDPNPVEPTTPTEPTDPTDPDSTSFLVVVSASHPLPENQEPELKTVQGSFKMQTTAADQMIAMLATAKSDGITLQVVSSYRSQAKQKQLYDAKVQVFLKQGYSQADAEATAATIVARPGTSEHNTGLAADIVTPDYLSLNKEFANTDAAKWLVDNCSRFGYILRYPEDKQDVTGIIYEPWHFRYVGVEAAQEIMRDGLCLEEYVAN